MAQVELFSSWGARGFEVMVPDKIIRGPFPASKQIPLVVIRKLIKAQRTNNQTQQTKQKRRKGNRVVRTLPFQRSV